MQRWLAENAPVDDEDLERHDKWLCMMWPRLQLMRELMADDACIFVSIDDHEQWRLLGLLEMTFGEANFISTFSFVQNLGAYAGRWVSEVTEYVHVFAKDISKIQFGEIATDEDPEADWERDELGPYRAGAELLKRGEGASRADRPNMYFPIYVAHDLTISLERHSTSDIEIYPTQRDGSDGRWMWSRERFAQNFSEVIVKPKPDGGFAFTTKVRPSIGNVLTKKPRTLWYQPQYSTPTGTNIVKNIFDGNRVFDFAKSPYFIKDLLRFAAIPHDGIILDSFAGSGTTAHAALALNRENDANRRFILIECEEYADAITAERARRVIKGIPGAKNPWLHDGLGGSFTYCTLGEPLDLETMLRGDSLPPYAELAAYLLYTATGVSVDGAELEPRDGGWFFGDDGTDYYLFYEPDLEWLQSNDAVFTEDQAKRIRAAAPGRSAVVFAAGKFIGQRELSRMNITFCQLPYELHRAGG